jgi:hypothetical protein
VIHYTFKITIEIGYHYFKQVLYAIRELREEMARALTGQTPYKI